MVHSSLITEWSKINLLILHFENEGIVTRRFRRLDPDRQQRIILSIIGEAAEKGPTHLNIKEVARIADVSVGSLYTYFPNRDCLLDFAIGMVTKFIVDDMESYRPILSSMPIRDGLSAYVAGGVEWSQLFAGFIRLFTRAAYQGDPEMQEHMVRPVANKLREIIKEMLVNAAARGEIRANIDIEVTTRVIHALTIAVGDSQILPYLNTYLQVSDDEIPPSLTTEAMVDMIMSGIGTNTNDR